MRIVYLDYNIIAGIAGLPKGANAASWQAAIDVLSGAGYRFALSAWHAFELAKSSNEEHVEACCKFVEATNPIWLSESSYVKQAEIEHFLDLAFRQKQINDGPPVGAAFNQAFSQMGATFKWEVMVGDSFRHMVQELRGTPGAIADVRAAAAETPGAIMTIRAAVVDGRYDGMKDVVDGEYFKLLVDQGEARALAFVLEHKKQVYSMCPTIAVDEQLMHIRAHEKFKPEEADATDLQHALVALAYCDHFVTNDGMLFEHCRQAAKQCDLPCRVHRNPTSIQVE